MHKKKITFLLFLSFHFFYISPTQPPYDAFNESLSVILFLGSKLKNPLISTIKSKNNEFSNKQIFDLPEELHTILAKNLMLKTKIQLGRTCKKFQEIYSIKSLLFSSLNTPDYTKALVYFSRKNDVETIKFLITKETSDNKEWREKILSILSKNSISNNLNEAVFTTMDVYKKKIFATHNTVPISEMEYINHPEILCLKLLQGLSPFSFFEGNKKYNLLHHIINNKYFELLNIILQSNIEHEKSALEYAIALDNSSAIEFLMKRNVSLYLPPKHNALTCAIYLHRSQCLETLLNNGANPNLLDKNGRTPLMIIALFRSSNAHEMLDILSRHNDLDYNLRTNRGSTALEYAFIQSLIGSSDPYIKDFLYEKTSLLNKCFLYLKIGIFATTICSGIVLIILKWVGFSDNNLFTINLRLFCLTAPLSTDMIKFFFATVAKIHPYYKKWKYYLEQ